MQQEIESYLNKIFDDLLLKDNGKTRNDIEAYYFLKVSVIKIIYNIVHATSSISSKENFRNCLPKWGWIEVRVPSGKYVNSRGFCVFYQTSLYGVSHISCRIHFQAVSIMNNFTFSSLDPQGDGDRLNEKKRQRSISLENFKILIAHSYIEVS